ncbi:MAG: 2-oxoacid:acceptor oxidoreductase family protein [Flavobacteriales bacterium]
MEQPIPTKSVEERSHVVILFAGDSGDGIQLTGSQFTDTNALFGNDVSTFPNFPAEIRAPQGTLAGVSGYQLHFGSVEIITPGDQCDVLVVMNAAALKANLSSLKKGGTIIANTDGFDTKNLRLAGYIDVQNPLTDGSLQNFLLHSIDITKMTRAALEDTTLGMKEKDRCKNMFVLGFINWMYSRENAHSVAFLERSSGKSRIFSKPTSGSCWLASIRRYRQKHSPLASRIEARTYAQGCLSQQHHGQPRSARAGSGRGFAEVGPLIFSTSSYPITPASDILHELSKHKNFGVKTFQAEDEM